MPGDLVDVTVADQPNVIEPSSDGFQYHIRRPKGCKEYDVILSFGALTQAQTCAKASYLF